MLHVTFYQLRCWLKCYKSVCYILNNVYSPYIILRNIQFYVLTVYINSVYKIYAVPDDELIDTKHAETRWI
jgi:hypothetical protein